ncbi:hypothetical protein GCM10025864_30980 [Luteimicrobium album]|uniref:Alanine racemase N-terminal domain-containing protein n=1 Tax=Luteimicrobium album TaxID=1054550 RepID=A0ABQ6I6D4_9MICO|nr:hypothetical protein GCM10025864_30980 [Luteimicrobium album]
MPPVSPTVRASGVRLLDSPHARRRPRPCSDGCAGPRPPPELVARVAANVERVRERIARAASDAGRDPASVRLLVATKTQPADAVLAAVAAGVDLVGENRVQELVTKAPALQDDVAAGRLRTHLIGHLQSNKVNAVVGLASCVETVDSLGLAQRLSRRAVAVGADLDVMVQVNVSGEASKSGIGPDRAADLALAVAALPGSTWSAS